MVRIVTLDARTAAPLLDQFAELLIDAVHAGASVGFLAPLAEADARQYWERVLEAVASGSRALLAAFEGDALLGSVQLDLAAMPNARHRAEVMKLFVHTRARRRSIARDLMQAIEDAARAHGRTLLVLDTRKGDTAEQLYRSIGYIEAGVIPRYAENAAGGLDDTVIFYRELMKG